MVPYTFQNFNLDTERVYHHLLDLRGIVSRPEEVVQYFRCLLIEGTGYPDPQIVAAVHRIAASRWAQREFGAFLNRCCYTLINYWSLHVGKRKLVSDHQTQVGQAIAQLVATLQIPATCPAASPTVQTLRDLVTEFTRTEQYAALQRRIRAIPWVATVNEPQPTQGLQHLLQRYHFLYPHCLLTDDSSEVGLHAIKQLQAERQRQFEKDLRDYALHLLRRTQATGTLANPSLLPARQLEGALRHFVGKVGDLGTYVESAQRFLARLQAQVGLKVQSARKQLGDYLTSAVQVYAESRRPKAEKPGVGYSDRWFTQWLTAKLQALPFHDHDPFSPHQLPQICRHLLDALIPDPHSDDHFVFLDLHSNLGATFIAGLILKIVLLCRTVAGSLEAVKARVASRFAALFRHYEHQSAADTAWLVECLENWLVALSTHFGQSDFSWVTLLPER